MLSLWFNRRCANCGYPVRGMLGQLGGEICPECGTVQPFKPETDSPLARLFERVSLWWKRQRVLIKILVGALATAALIEYFILSFGGGPGCNC